MAMAMAMAMATARGYNLSDLPDHLSRQLGTINTSTTSPGDDLDLFFHCWTRPHCPACLSPSNPYPCSWCATSQTCVPNTIYPYPFGILSPIKSDTICPLGWRERWEMRARPFSCRCSSMTFISVAIAVLATLLGVLSIWLAIRLGRWVGRSWKRRREGWWRPRSWTRTNRSSTESRAGATSQSAAEETTPLLA